MTQVLRLMDRTQHQQLYAELTDRNRHFVSRETQGKLRDLKVLIAGCGSAGGAFAEGLSRLGVTHFRLADNGDYEVSNLNRQHAFLDTVGTNKAVYHRDQILRLNPGADVVAFPEGIMPSNVAELVAWADVVLDAVDVTTRDAIEMKLILHEVCHLQRKLVYSPLDLAFCQWGRSFDYRNGQLRPLAGRLDAARSARHPIKVLFTMYSPAVIPAQCLELVIELLEKPGGSASQLCCAADLLAAVIAPTMIRFVETGEAVSGWRIDLAPMALSWRARLLWAIRAPVLRLKLWRLLARTA